VGEHNYNTRRAAALVRTSWPIGSTGIEILNWHAGQILGVGQLGGQGAKSRWFEDIRGTIPVGRAGSWFSVGGIPVGGPMPATKSRPLIFLFGRRQTTNSSVGCFMFVIAFVLG
jgi:hypothetical protein